MKPDSPQFHSPEKVVRLIEFAPALALAFLVVCLTITKGFLPLHGGAGVSMLFLTASLLSCVAALLFPEVALPRFENVPLLRIALRAPALTLLLACLAFQWLVLCNWFFASLPIFGMIPRQRNPFSKSRTASANCVTSFVGLRGAVRRPTIFYR